MGGKDIGKCWDWNPYLALQKPVAIPIVLWEFQPIFRFQRNRHNIRQSEDSNLDLLLEKFCPHPTDGTFQSIGKIN